MKAKEELQRTVWEALPETAAAEIGMAINLIYSAMMEPQRQEFKQCLRRLMVDESPVWNIGAAEAEPRR